MAFYWTPEYFIYPHTYIISRMFYINHSDINNLVYGIELNQI